MLILEIALGVFLGLGTLMAFCGWRANRQRERRLEAQLDGLTTDQLHMLRAVHDPAEFDRMTSAMHDMEPPTNQLGISHERQTPPNNARGRRDRALPRRAGAVRARR
jgi:hypothetical protein